MKTFKEWYDEYEKRIIAEDKWENLEDAWNACAAEYEKILERYKNLTKIAYELVDKVVELHPEIKDKL